MGGLAVLGDVPYTLFTERQCDHIYILFSRSTASTRRVIANIDLYQQHRIDYLISMHTLAICIPYLGHLNEIYAIVGCEQYVLFCIIQLPTPRRLSEMKT